MQGGVEDPVLARVVRDYELLFRGFYSELRHHDELSFCAHLRNNPDAAS